MGITYSQPIYSLDESDDDDGTNGIDDHKKKKKIFVGVVAFDYTLEQITRFLVEQYNETDIHVLAALAMLCWIL